ncbi:MAG: copper transporter [Limnochordia bacterium]
MIIDMRHHLFSLVSVFLALGLGILIGTSISSDGRVAKEQSVVIDAIEAQLSQLRRERQAMQADLSQTEAALTSYQEFAHQVLPQLVAGQLIERKVGLVIVGESTDTSSLQELMRLSGAQVNGSVLVNGDALTASGKVQTQLVHALAAAFFHDVVSTPGDQLMWQQMPVAKVDSVVVVDSASAQRARQLAALLQTDVQPASVVVVGDLETPIEQWALVEHLARDRP